MKEFWVRFEDKVRFIESSRGHHLSEISNPMYKVTEQINGIASVVTKYYHYRVDVTDEEYMFLKLQFDLKETI